MLFLQEVHLLFAVTELITQHRGRILRICPCLYNARLAED